MKKLTAALIAGCMSVAVTSAYAAQGSPADTDKAGRMGPGTSAGQMGAADPTPGKAGPGTMGGNRTGASTGAGATSTTTGSGASSSTTSTDTAASSSTGTSTPKAKRSRRAARATRG